MQFLLYHRFEVLVLPNSANQGAAEKTAFIMDKGKWIIHSLLLDINIGPLAFSYVLGKVLASCIEFAPNYLNNIMIFSSTWEEYLEHLEAVFKQLEAAKLKIKCSKCEFFKTKVHYLVWCR